MAAASPAISSSSPDTAAVAAASALHRSEKTPKTLRGQNKPKCIQCGNVARSRCPYESCKSCCSKAQNPCHIHVLKQNATLDKTPAPSIPLFDLQKTEVTPPGTSQRVHSMRQHYLKNLTQFNNVHSLRARKPLTRKDAVALNEWRFSKLKEYMERNIEVENEAFDRYMQNVSLLEEVFSAKSILEESIDDGSAISNPNPTSVEAQTRIILSSLKLKLRSNPVRTDNFRKRIQEIVDQGLKKLQQNEADGGINETNNENEVDRRPKKMRVERASAFNDLIDRLNKARNEDDLKSCFQIKSHLCNRQIGSSKRENEDVEVSREQTTRNDLSPQKRTEYCLPKLYSTTDIDQETLKSVDVHFSILEQIDDL